MKSSRGFSLVELILVIVILGVLASVITVFVRPAAESFIAQRQRSELQSAAQAALHAMNRDVRLALPNSIRTPNAQCFELVPTIGGGRYRTAADTVHDASPACSSSETCSAALDTSTSTERFDVLGPLSGQAAVGDHVVVGNQNGDEVYAGSNRSVIGALSNPAANLGSLRISIAPRQFPLGYSGGRFAVVPAGEQAVFYACSGVGLDGQGNGSGQLLRYRSYGFRAAYPADCSSPGGVSEVLATRVEACNFEYSSNALTEQGLMSLRLQLRRADEAVSLQVHSMVSNIP